MLGQVAMEIVRECSDHRKYVNGEEDFIIWGKKLTIVIAWRDCPGDPDWWRAPITCVYLFAITIVLVLYICTWPCCVWEKKGERGKAYTTEGPLHGQPKGSQHGLSLVKDCCSPLKLLIFFGGPIFVPGTNSNNSAGSRMNWDGLRSSKRRSTYEGAGVARATRKVTLPDDLYSEHSEPWLDQQLETASRRSLVSRFGWRSLLCISTMSISHCFVSRFG